MPSLVPGRIVYSDVPIPDPQGKNPKEGRPFIVISNADEIKSRGLLCAVGITSSIDQSPADNLVTLPSGPTARSGLKKKSAALCTWLDLLEPDKVQFGKGFIRADLVDQIVTKVLELHPELTAETPEDPQ